MKQWKKYLTVIIGIFIVAISYNLFFKEYNLDTGGVSGLALVIHHFFSIEESTFILICNIILIMISYFVLGKDLTKNTILGSLLFPIFINLTSNINQFIKIEGLETIIIAIIGGTLSGIGYGLIFKNNYTSGGTDIINQIMEKKFKIPMSKSMIVIDGIIVLLGFFAFGMETMIYSVIALILISTLSNKTMIGIGNNKAFYIQTSQYDKIIDYLTVDLRYDVTIFNTEGGYTKTKDKLILCSVSTNDYYKVKTGVLLIDPNAFLTITEIYELMNENVMVPSKSL